MTNTTTTDLTNLMDIKEEESTIEPNVITISKDDLTFILNILISCNKRGIFALEEYEIIGKYYSKINSNLKKVTQDTNIEQNVFTISKDDLTFILNILISCNKRGVFALEEYEVIGKFYSKLSKLKK